MKKTDELFLSSDWGCGVSRASLSGVIWASYIRSLNFGLEICLFFFFSLFGARGGTEGHVHTIDPSSIL